MWKATVDWANTFVQGLSAASPTDWNDLGQTLDPRAADFLRQSQEAMTAGTDVPTVHIEGGSESVIRDALEHFAGGASSGNMDEMVKQVQAMMGRGP